VSPSEDLPAPSELNKSLEIWLADLGIAKIAAVFIETFGSLSGLLAQFLYVSQPLLETWLPAERLTSLAESLEDEQKSAALATRLRMGRE